MFIQLHDLKNLVPRTDSLEVDGFAKVHQQCSVRSGSRFASHHPISPARGNLASRILFNSLLEQSPNSLGNGSPLHIRCQVAPTYADTSVGFILAHAHGEQDMAR